MSFHTEAQLKMAVDDICHGLARADVWLTLGWQDIRQRFRRSILGPFWLTLSTAIMLVALGFVYATIFKMELHDYFPFLAAGIVTWTLIFNLVTEGCQTFIASETMIKQIRLPFTAHAGRVVWRNFVVLLHNLVIMLVVLWVFERWPGPLGLLSFLGGLALVLVNGVWVALLLGLICARFRDVPPIVGSSMQLMFFITPIIWHPSLLPGRQRVIDWNPFYHFIELVRAPMLGGQVSAVTWCVALGITAAGWIVTFLVLLRYRRRIAYWI